MTRSRIGASGLSRKSVTRSTGPRDRSKARRASSTSRRWRMSAPSSGPASGVSTIEMETSSDGAITASGAPRSQRNVVRSASWRATTASIACCNRRSAMGPGNSTITAMLYAGFSGADRTRCHTLSCASEAPRGAVRQGVGILMNCSMPGSNDQPSRPGTETGTDHRIGSRIRLVPPVCRSPARAVPWTNVLMDTRSRGPCWPEPSVKSDYWSVCSAAIPRSSRLTRLRRPSCLRHPGHELCRCSRKNYAICSRAQHRCRSA